MRRIVVLAVVLVAVLGITVPAAAHPEHWRADALTTSFDVLTASFDPYATPFSPFIANKQQHGEAAGHLPPVQKNVDLVGKLDLFEGKEEQPGRIADVAAYGDYAYLGAFASPNCEDPGVYVVDISNPAAPKEADFIPTSNPTSFVGEGVQVLEMNTKFFKGPLLLYSQETCAPGGGPVLGPDPRVGAAGPGGATLVDVRDPENWKKLADHVGDEDPPPAGGIPSGVPHNSHSVFGWHQGDKAYMIVMDNGEGGDTDLDIFDITNPAAPVLKHEIGMGTWPKTDCNPSGTDEDCPSVILDNPQPNGASPFIHDFVVKNVGGKWLLLASYWDGGYVIVDLSDLPAEPTYLRDTDFGPQEPFSTELNLPANTTPDGNAHQAEFSLDGSMFIGTDEDFNPNRFLGTITSGSFTGHGFTGAEGNATPPIGPDGLSGGVTYVGYGCPAPPPASPNHRIALAERGSPPPLPSSCPFSAKVQAAEAAGYEAIVIFNDPVTDKPNCDALVNMLAVGNIPSLFVGRSAGLKLMNTNPGANSCDTPTPSQAPGTAGQSFDMRTLFDGWGYMHLYDANTMEPLDHWALPESLQPENAEGKGDLTVHEVAMDPRRNRGYISYYSGGFRVFDFSREGGLQEVGAYIDEGGNNFWGVEVHPDGNENPLVLASDRDSGLYLFRYRPPVGEEPAGPTVPREDTATQSVLDASLTTPLLASTKSSSGRQVPMRIRTTGFDISHLVLQYRRTGRGTKTVYKDLSPRLNPSTKRIFFTQGEPGRTYLFRIRAVTTRGVESGWRYARLVFPYDDRGKGRRYSGGWTRVKNTRAWRGGYSRSSRRGATLEFTTKGGGRAYLIARTGPNGGKALVGRGSKKQVVSFYSKRPRHRRVVMVVNRTAKRAYRFRLKVLRGTVTVDGIAVRRR